MKIVTDSNILFYKSFVLCKDIDEKDTPSVALSLFLDVPLLTGDKKLHSHLRNKSFNTMMLNEIITI